MLKKVMRLSFFLSSIAIFIFLETLSKPYNTCYEKVLICGVGKNIEDALPNMMSKIEALGKNFKDYRVIIYENNSSDRTQELLKGWANKNFKIILMSENLSNKNLHNLTKAHTLSHSAPNRTEIIAYARNRTLNIAMSSCFDDYKFLIMLDLDFYIGWIVPEVLSSFALKESWDCLAANSLDFNGYYYDRYALRDMTKPLGPELLGQTWWYELNSFPLKIDPTSSLVKIYSAFGGIAIYKRKALKNCFYSGIATTDLELLLHEIINNKMDKGEHQYVQYKNLLNCTSSCLPVRFIPNSGCDIPIVCEHSPLHASMIRNGYDKLYINPAMTCRYECMLAI